MPRLASSGRADEGAGTVKFSAKSDAREHVWERLTTERQARFPFPVKGRIPNFVGAEAAAARLFALPIWNGVRAIKVNPDSPQLPVREEALRRGIVLYMPTPRLAAGFLKFDPAKIAPENYRAAATLSKCKSFAEEIALEDFPQVDLIVCGSVAVTATGKRCGKGHGYADLEYGILRELGHKPVPVLTTVHEISVLEDFPRDENDVPLSFIATPERVIEVKSPPPAPKGILWEKLSEKDLEEMPVLAELRNRTLSRSP